MEIRPLTSDADRREAVPIVRQLWSDATAGEVLDWTGEENYHLFGAVEGASEGTGHEDGGAAACDGDLVGVGDGDLVGVAGVLVAGHLHHVRLAWLYDLVVDEPRRGEGYGTALVDHVEAWAADRGLDRVALASPLSKEDVHAFYGDRGYERWGYVLERGLEEAGRS
ncbi:GNAT family N-acetyltransferase [Halobaculum sp. EA56]|uniref:GNAT family N-acetyltransferase n=1 Tax=Halobaculum sp. EA56 TaxID=3421648 RepID=UPI003EBA24AA